MPRYHDNRITCRQIVVILHIKTLAALTKNTLVLEFVKQEDPIIQHVLATPNFFDDSSIHETVMKNYVSYAQQHYTLDIVKKLCHQYFASVTELPSHPISRVLLVCKKNK